VSWGKKEQKSTLEREKGAPQPYHPEFLFNKATKAHTLQQARGIVKKKRSVYRKKAKFLKFERLVL